MKPQFEFGDKIFVIGLVNPRDNNLLSPDGVKVFKMKVISIRLEGETFIYNGEYSEDTIFKDIVEVLKRIRELIE